MERERAGLVSFGLIFFFTVFVSVFLTGRTDGQQTHTYTHTLTNRRTDRVTLLDLRNPLRLLIASIIDYDDASQLPGVKVKEFYVISIPL